MNDLIPRVSRRTTLAWLATATAWSAAHGKSLALAKDAGRPRSLKPSGKGYGTDPDLLHPTVTWDRSMTRTQLLQCSVLADLILPPSAGAPAPSAVGVADFIDEWISAPYATQVADRPIILQGLAWLDDQSLLRNAKSWLMSTESECLRLLDEIAAFPTSTRAGDQHQFFLRARYLIVGAYYTTEAGWKDLGYIGNVPLKEFPKVTPSVVALLEERLKKLGV